MKPGDEFSKTQHTIGTKSVIHSKKYIYIVGMRRLGRLTPPWAQVSTIIHSLKLYHRRFRCFNLFSHLSLAFAEIFHLHFCIFLVERSHRSDDDGGVHKEQARNGERQRYASSPRRSSSRGFCSSTIRTTDPVEGTQRRRHISRRFRNFLLGYVSGRQGQ